MKLKKKRNKFINADGVETQISSYFEEGNFAPPFNDFNMLEAHLCNLVLSKGRINNHLLSAEVTLIICTLICKLIKRTAVFARPLCLLFQFKKGQPKSSQFESKNSPYFLNPLLY